jgi:hypothetical protein
MSSALTCPECASPFAVDQRYCTECGHRVWPLPHNIAGTLAALSGSRRIGTDRLLSTGAGGASSTSGASGARDSRLMLFGQPVEVPSPRAMAVGVLALLAFGVIIGTGSFSLASSPLLVTVNRPAATAATAATTPPSAPLALSSPSTSSAPATSGGSAGGTTAASAPTSSGSASGTNTPTSTPSSSPGTTSTSSSSATSNGLPPIKHVWIIQLGDQGYANTFDSTSSDTYLNKTLATQGEVVPNVYASATSDLANEIGLISGQGPTVQTENNCPTYSAITPGTVGTDGQVSGDGCVYPDSTTSFESELSAAGLSWKAYEQGQGILPASSCIHPELAAADSHFSLTSPAGYVTWRNPLVYLTDVTSGGCTYQDTGLAKLKTDLSESATTPNVSFIYANPCDDGTDTPCLPGAASGTTQSDAFLQSVVPEIMNSAAYKADGMILITFAQAPQTGADADHSSCCDQPTQFPNLPSADYEPSATTTTATGTTTTGTGTTGTGTTGTATTGTGTATTGTDTTATTTTTGAATAPVTTTVPVPFNTATISGPIITIPGVSAPIGTTTSPQGLITGTETTATVTLGATSPIAAGTTTTASATTTTSTTVSPCPTTTGTGTTTTETTGTGTGTTASTDCCPTSTTGTTTAGTTSTTGTTTAGTTTMTSGTPTGTTGAATTATGSTITGTGTGTTEMTASTVCCPTASTGTTTTGTTTTASGTTTGTTGAATTATESTTTGTGTTDTTASTVCCPSTSTSTTTGTGTTTATVPTGTTTSGTATTGTSTTPGCPTTTSASGSASPTGGGGQVGMLVLSKYVTPNSPDGIDYFNTFSITASLEQLFSLKPTGYASTTGLPVFSSFFYSAYNSG